MDKNHKNRASDLEDEDDDVISVRAVRDGYMRYQRKWAQKPVLCEIRDFEGERPQPREGAEFVMSPAEYRDLQWYVGTPNAQMHIDRPNDVQLAVAGEVARIAEIRQAIDKEAQALSTLRGQREAAEAEVSSLAAQRDAVDRLAAEAEDRAQRAEAAARAAEERLAKAREELEAVEEAKRSRAKK